MIEISDHDMQQLKYPEMMLHFLASSGVPTLGMANLRLDPDYIYEQYYDADKQVTEIKWRLK